MSEGPAETGTGPATGQGTPAGTAGAGQAADDEGAAGLLEGMMGKGDQGTPGASPADDLQSQLTHWKEMAKKNEKRAKDNAAAATKLQEIERQNMTELEKAQAAQRDAEAARDEALASHARIMAAAANNLPVELIDYLGTGTDEEINERAELLASCIEETAGALAEQLLTERIASGELMVGNVNGRNGQVPQPQSPGARPVESMRPGSAPAGATPNTNEQWFRQLIHGQ